MLELAASRAVALIELPRTWSEHREANDLMEVSRRQLEAMRRQTDDALEQAERMNELLGRVVRLTEPLERAQRGGEYVGEALKRAIFGEEQAAVERRRTREARPRSDRERQGGRGGDRGRWRTRSRQPEERRDHSKTTWSGEASRRPLRSLPPPANDQEHPRLEFSLCELSQTDPAFPRYPRLPVGAAADSPSERRGRGGEPHRPSRPVDGRRSRGVAAVAGAAAILTGGDEANGGASARGAPGRPFGRARWSERRSARRGSAA